MCMSVKKKTVVLYAVVFKNNSSGFKKKRIKLNILTIAFISKHGNTLGAPHGGSTPNQNMKKKVSDLSLLHRK